MKELIKRICPDRLYIQLQYRKRMKKSLNLQQPVTFNEKIQYIKLYDKNPLYTFLADKVLVKEYVQQLIGSEYVIPTLGKWSTFKDINFDVLPQQFVLKCNHDSGTVAVFKTKDELQLSKIEKLFSQALKRNFFYPGREWAYKNIRPKIFAEMLIQSSTSNDLEDYKLFCFNGKVDSIMLCKARHTGYPKFYFFDREWKFLKYNRENSDLPDDFTLEKPKNLDLMIELAEILTQGFRFVRLDLYNVDGKIYFGEYTFYPDCGYDSTFTEAADVYYGNKIDLADLALVNR